MMVVPPTSLGLNSVPDRKLDGFLLGRDGTVHPASTPLGNVLPVLPANGKAARETVLFVNGITCTAAQQRVDMQALANDGYRVVGLHNATEGLVKDVVQSALDKLDLGNNPAVNALTWQLHRALDRGQPLHIVAHSQGALETSRALKRVERDWRAQGLSSTQIAQRFSKLTVETLGGAATFYPDGPRYRHYVNAFDAIPMLAGLGSPGAHPGARADVEFFHQINAPRKLDFRKGVVQAVAQELEEMVHDPRSVYFPRMKPEDTFG